MYGLLDCKAVTHTIDGDTFYDFIQSSLLPNLMPFNGYNHPNRQLCFIHHFPGVIEMIQELVHFLPPYCPDFNPIEEAFSKVKTTLRTMDREAESLEDPLSLVLASFSTILHKMTVNTGYLMLG